MKEIESEAQSKQAAKLIKNVDAACHKFDRIKLMQSQNCDKAAVSAFMEVKRMGGNPNMLGAAKRGVDARSIAKSNK